MPRYVINVSSNGHRLFSTSRSSIGADKEKLAHLVNLLDIIVSGAPDEEDMSMEVVLIGDSKAETVQLNGESFPVVGKVDYHGSTEPDWPGHSDYSPWTLAEGVMYADLGGDPDTNIGPSRFVVRPLRTGTGVVIGYSMTRDNEEVGHFASSYEAVEYAKTSKF